MNLYAKFPSKHLDYLSPTLPISLFLFLYQVIALYDYESQGYQELDFEEGDIITVIAKEDDVWWCGQIKGKIGMFPSTYVEAYDQVSVYRPIGACLIEQLSSPWLVFDGMFVYYLIPIVPIV